jgi:large subunit ribosomal protein L3
MLGLIGKKIGMTQVFDDGGVLTPVTVISVEPNVVVGKKTDEAHGYSSIVLGCADKKKNRVTKAYAGQFAENIPPKKILREMRNFSKEVSVGDVLGVELFEATRFVDVTATSKGKGFQGVMKRWGFHGGRSTHGSKFHREPGSTGQCTYPGHSFKNIKMPGRMGGDVCTAQNLRVVKIDAEKKVILVRGAVPGARNCILVIKSAVKKAK